MSRLPPKMEQKEAIEARLYNVLPIKVNGLTYFIKQISIDEPAGIKYILEAKDDADLLVWATEVYNKVFIPFLEKDVQDVFVVNLYREEEYIAVKLEYAEPLYFSLKTGERRK